MSIPIWKITRPYLTSCLHQRHCQLRASTLLQKHCHCNWWWLISFGVNLFWWYFGVILNTDKSSCEPMLALKYLLGQPYQLDFNIKSVCLVLILCYFVAITTGLFLFSIALIFFLYFFSHFSIVRLRNLAWRIDLLICVLLVHLFFFCMRQFVVFFSSSWCQGY